MPRKKKSAVQESIPPSQPEQNVSYPSQETPQADQPTSIPESIIQDDVPVTTDRMQNSLDSYMKSQLAPAAPKRQKRYSGPKEFSVALKAAESRLAKAINERAEAMGKLAGLQAEIPSLMAIIQDLKAPSQPQISYAPAMPYDLSAMGQMGGIQGIATPVPAMPQLHPQPDLAAIQAAMAQPPVSKASGGTMQFGPEVLGSLEGPEDDDDDKFLQGPAAGSKGWI